MNNFIIKNLCYFPSFRKAVIEFAFNSQSKSYKENLQVAFYDSNMLRYYTFIDFKKMPLKRLEMITKMQEVVREGMKRNSGGYLKEWIETAELAIEKSKTPKVDFGRLLHSLKERSKLFDEDLLIELLAVSYIREDENPAEYSEVLHQEKITQFKKDLRSKAGGLFDFFTQAGLKDFLPSGVTTAIDYEEFTKSSKTKIEKMVSELQKTSLLLQGLKE